MFFADAFVKVIPGLEYHTDEDYDEMIYFYTDSMIRDRVVIEYEVYVCEHDTIHTAITVFHCTEDNASEYDLFSGAVYLESIQLLTIIREIVQLHKDYTADFGTMMNLLSGQSSSAMQSNEDHKPEYERISGTINMVVEERTQWLKAIAEDRKLKVMSE